MLSWFLTSAARETEERKRVSRKAIWSWLSSEPKSVHWMLREGMEVTISLCNNIISEKIFASTIEFHFSLLIYFMLLNPFRKISAGFISLHDVLRCHFYGFFFASNAKYDIWFPVEMIFRLKLFTLFSRFQFLSERSSSEKCSRAMYNGMLTCGKSRSPVRCL